MKIKYCILSLLPFVLSGCVKEQLDKVIDDELMMSRNTQENYVFYYYAAESRQIALREVKDKVFVKFAPGATKEQFRAATKVGGVSLRTKEFDAERSFVEGSSLNMAILESGDISSDAINALKNREEIVSATHLLEYNGKSVGLTDEFIVKLKGETSYARLQELAKENGCEIGEENEFVEGQYKLRVPKTSELNAMQMANRFYETGLFEFSEPDLVCFDVLCAAPDYFPYQWGLQSGANYGIDILTAWMMSKGGGSIEIAILDNGVQRVHPDFYWMPRGYDVTAGPVGNSLGQPVRADDNHGTAVAGIAVALDNGQGVSGVAPGCRIMPIKVANGTSSSTSHLADGINRAVNNGADVINISLGGTTPSSTCTNAIVNALRNGRSDVNRGCVIVCASGNENSAVSYPANCNPDIIAVGAIDNSGAKADFSNFGLELDVVAPGYDIYTTDRTGAAGYRSDDYCIQSGTSLSTPFVSGIAALLLSLDPYLSPQRVSEIITKTASTYPSRTNQMGYGLVNARDALAELLYLDYAQVSGPANPVVNTTAVYTFPTLPYASIVPFDHWEMSGSNFQTSNSSTDYRISAKFTSTGPHTLTGYYNLPNGRHRIIKTINVVQ